MRSCLAVLALAALGAAAPQAPARTCAEQKGGAELTVRCSDGTRLTVRSAGLILPPVLRCSPSLPECCETGFRTLRDIQLNDLLRVAEGQAPLCHMLASDVLKNPPATDLLSALPEIDDLSPTDGALVCPRGQHPARGRCHDPAALLQAARLPVVADRNRVLVPEASDLVRTLRDELDATGRCPRSALDIGVVMRLYLAAEQRSHLFQGEGVDVGPLLAQPRDPEGVLPDPSLPVACGYNATHTQWYQTSFHCRDARLCFDQSHDSLSHSCVGFGRQGNEPWFRPIINCRNIPPCQPGRGGPCTGLARLIPLGEGVFLRVLLGLSGDPYYYGLVFSPPRPEAVKLRKQAAEARALLQEMLQQIKDPAEKASLRRMLGSLPAVRPQPAPP
ncbi:MAG: hypothetical protein RMK29_21980 [Myxococcales bacterium]|nr:hypothetical protein [Myxococcota bacterium]MDW8284384.1 hypothetical protein [Myxococcales bacterium]